MFTNEILDTEIALKTEEFLENVGMNDKKAEYERAVFYKDILRKEYDFTVLVNNNRYR